MKTNFDFQRLFHEKRETRDCEMFPVTKQLNANLKGKEGVKVLLLAQY